MKDMNYFSLFDLPKTKFSVMLHIHQRIEDQLVSQQQHSIWPAGCSKKSMEMSCKICNWWYVAVHTTFKSQVHSGSAEYYCCWTSRAGDVVKNSKAVLEMGEIWSTCIMAPLCGCRCSSASSNSMYSKFSTKAKGSAQPLCPTLHSGFKIVYKIESN